MNTRFLSAFLAYIGLVSVAIGQAAAPAEIELHITGEDITWPQIWEAGFRPVHHIGMTKCLQRDVFLSIRFRDEEEVFVLGRGDVEFSILKGDAVYQLAFYGRAVLTLEEGADRIALFSRVFGKILEKSGTPLKALDSYGTVDTSTNTGTSSARFGEYRILHGFNSSFRAKTPLLDILTISLRSKYIDKIGFRTSAIQPPAGYEDLSMQPEQAVPAPKGEVLEKEEDRLAPPRESPPPDGQTPDDRKQRRGTLWGWILAVLVSFSILLAWRRRQVRTSGDSGE
jgi:hypothetical protein